MSRTAWILILFALSAIQAARLPSAGQGCQGACPVLMCETPE